MGSRPVALKVGATASAPAQLWADLVNRKFWVNGLEIFVVNEVLLTLKTERF